MAATSVQNAAPVAEGAAAQPVTHNSSLYVGDLDRDVTEAELFDLFSQVGPVASIRVCRDAVTRRSLGYAYVNYNSSLDPQAAERALETLNYTPMNSMPMRIMWSHRDPAQRKSGVGNVFIKNLDKSIDNKALYDTFSAFGPISSCKVATGGDGLSKGYGFVHYMKEEGAKLAIEKVNGMLLEGRMVYVGPFKPRDERPGGEMKFTNVYVKNLDEAVTEEELREVVAPYGDITSCVVMKDEEGKSKGFGFINFEDHDAAAAAVEALNGKSMHGKEVYAGRAQKKTEREGLLKQKVEEQRQERLQKYQGMNLYIKNLVDDMDDDKLRAEFAPYGTITSAKVMKDPATGKSRGFGFVCFTLPEEATKAVTETNGRMIGGKPIYVALAQRKDMRKQQLEQQYTQRMPPAMAAGGARGPLGPMPGPYGAAPPMFYAGPGAMGPPGARPGGMPGMYPQVMPRGMPQGGRGPRGMMMQQGGMGMMGPGARSGRGGRGGRGGGRGDGPKGRGMQTQWVPQQRGPRPAGPPGPMGPPGGPANGPMPPQPAPPMAPPAPAAPSAVVPGQEGGQLTTAMLAAAPAEQQKQMLGERLFPLVSARQPELSGKITGMLLEMDNSELLLLLESPEALDSKVDEAITVLKQHGALPEGDAPSA